MPDKPSSKQFQLNAIFGFIILFVSFTTFYMFKASGWFAILAIIGAMSLFYIVGYLVRLIKYLLFEKEMKDEKEAGTGMDNSGKE